MLYWEAGLLQTGKSGQPFLFFFSSTGLLLLMASFHFITSSFTVANSKPNLYKIKSADQPDSAKTTHNLCDLNITMSKMFFHAYYSRIHRCQDLVTWNHQYLLVSLLHVPKIINERTYTFNINYIQQIFRHYNQDQQ